MKWLNKLNINQKIVAAILVSLLFLAIVLGFIIWESLTKMMTEDLRKRGENIANSIVVTTSDYIITDDHYSIYLLINQIKKANEDVRYILVFNSRHDLVGHTFSDYLPKGILDARTLSENRTEYVPLTSDEGKIHDLLVPIKDGDIGFVRVGMAENQAKIYIFSKITELIFATLLVCLGAAGLAYCVTKIITKPINNLVETATGISEGKLSLRAQITGKDEVAKLAESFNKMADHLIDSRANVEKLLNELQEKERLRDHLIIKLLSAQEDERKRISRELHDETSQALTSLIVTMRILSNEAQNSEQHELLQTSREIAVNVLREIRDIAIELRPPILDDIGIISAIKKYIRNFEEKFSLPVNLQTPEKEIEGVDNRIAVALYRIVQESLTNIIKHADASKIEVKIVITDDSLHLTINDNGKGIREEDFEKAYEQNRIGIYGMKERAELIGGSFYIQANRQGGTHIAVSIPIIKKAGITIEKND